MKKEFNLSSKSNYGLHEGNIYLEEDVKKFIRLLKDKVHNGPDGYDKKSHRFIGWIDKLAGEKLL